MPNPMLNMRSWNSERTAWMVILALIAVALILKLINVFNAPAHWDTSLYLNIAVGYFERGILTPLMWRYNPEWNILTGSGAGYGVFIVIGWLRVFGVSVLSGHLLMYVVGLLNLPVIYLLAKRYYHSPQAGLWAMGFFALSGTFAGSYFVRMDALNTLACSLILLLHLEAVRRDRWWLHALVGVALVAALEVHILAALYAGAIGLRYLVDHVHCSLKRRSVLFWSPALTFGVSLGLAAGVYYWHHIAPNPDLYFLISRHCAICTPLSPAKELVRWVEWLRFQPLIFAAILGIRGLSLLGHRSMVDRQVLVMVGGAYLALLILNPPVLDYYTGHILPLLALMVGGLFAQGLNPRRPQLPALRLTGLAMYTIAIAFLWQGTSFTFGREYLSSPMLAASRPVQMDHREYRAAIDYIRAHIPRDVVIVGREAFFNDLVEYSHFLSQYGIEQYGIMVRQESYVDFLRRERPQVLIGDARSDPDLQQYAQWHGGFVEVLPKLWVDRALVKPDQG